MKLKFRADKKDIKIFIIFCIVLLYLVAIAVCNVVSFLGENEFSVVSGEEMEKNHAAYCIYGEIVPFNEAICIGNPIADFASTAFIEERLCSLNTSYLIYKVKISSQLHRIPKDKDVNLVFGYDMFCSINLLY